MDIMSLPPEITLEDFQNVVQLLKSAIHEMAELAHRVQILEKANEAHLEAALALKDSQQKFFEAQKAQQEFNTLVKESLDELLHSIGRRYPMIQ